MVTEKTLMKFGLTKDSNNSKLKEVFENNIKLKQIHIDIYPENPLITSSAPFMLLLRTIEKNVIVSNDEDRLILKSGNNYETYILNILLSKIEECFYKVYDDYSEFIFNIQNIYYRLIILN